MVSQSYVTRYQSIGLLWEEIITKIYLLHFTDFFDIFSNLPSTRIIEIIGLIFSMRWP